MLLVVLLFLVFVFFAVLILLLLVELLEAFFDDVGVKQRILVLKRAFELLTQVVGAFKLLHRTGPLLDFIVRILGCLAEPKQRVAEVIKRALLKWQGGLGDVERLAKVCLGFFVFLGLVGGGAGVVVQAGPDRGVSFCF